MPAYDRPQRQSVKAMSKTEAAVADEKRNAELMKTRRNANALAATNKRQAKETMEGLSDQFSNMSIAGRRRRGRGRGRITRRRARRNPRA